MLQHILQAMSAGGVHSLRELAQQLDTSEQLLESMIDQLVRMGYLKPLSAPCVGQCHNCPEANHCSIGGSGRAWVLTVRGERMAQR